MAKKQKPDDPPRPRGGLARIAALATGSPEQKKEPVMATKDDTRNADFIGRVVGDAKNPPETRMLTGWLGDAAEAGYRRLYTDADLSAYVDIPTDAILYTEPIRDVQPAGGVFVWIKRDAALKQGGSAASRAARFLKGQVQQDFASGGGAGAAAPDADSLKKAGYRCVTQVPCAEPTGLTGLCTKQPDVGGAWPCLTAPPHCAEPTGFTGKCTPQPWPNPTRYIGCTVFHCPTQDLTHVPHICHLVETGLPGCGGVNPPDAGGDPVKAAAKEKGGSPEAAEAVTVLPGCGFTKRWGPCDTQLLGCGFTKEWGNQCPTQIPGCGETRDCPTTLPGCGWSKNPICTDLPGCGFTKPLGVCQPTQPPKCQPSVNIPCPTISETPACGGGGAEAANLAAGQVGAPASAICATNIGCNPTLFCPTRNLQICFPTAFCPTRFRPQCFPIPSPFCPVTPRCPFGPGGGGQTPVLRGFGAAQDAIIATPLPQCQVTHVVGCTVPPTGMEQCTQFGPNCPSFPPTQCPPTQCTQTGPQCPTSCGPDCQSQQVDCTKIGPLCGHEVCTPNPEVCPTIGIICTQFQPQCPGDTFQPECHPTFKPPQCPIETNPLLDCTFGCTQVGTGCNTIQKEACVFTVPGCQTIDVARQAFGAAAAIGTTGVQGGCIQPTIWTQLRGCTQFGPQCPTQPNGDCTFFGCPSIGQAGAGAVPGCTQFGPQCPTQPKGDCTFFGCPPTPATICTQFGPDCPTQPNGDCTFFGNCPTQPKGDCTFFGCPTRGEIGPAGPIPGCTCFGPQCPTQAKPCTQIGPACPPTPATVCTQFAPCPTRLEPQCPTRHFECTMFCTQGAPGCPPSVQDPACQFAGRGGDLGGGGVARFGAAAQPQAIGGGYTPWFPTPATRCFICPPLGTTSWRCI